GGTADLYYAPLTRDGETRGAAILIPELSHPTATDQGATLRTDGREILFFSTRPAGLGGADLWTSTRRSVHAPWSTPVNPRAPLPPRPGSRPWPSPTPGGPSRRTSGRRSIRPPAK